MSQTKLCPFNNMAPCSKQCALYILPSIVVGEQNASRVDIEVDELLAGRCAMSVGAITNLLLYAANQLESKLEYDQKTKTSALE